MTVTSNVRVITIEVRAGDEPLHELLEELEPATEAATDDEKFVSIRCEGRRLAVGGCIVVGGVGFDGRPSVPLSLVSQRLITSERESSLVGGGYRLKPPLTLGAGVSGRLGGFCTTEEFEFPGSTL